MNDWNTYHIRTKNKSPRSILVEAVSHCTHRKTALDLGAGALNDARYLTEQGFRVVAIDSNPHVTEFANNLDVRVMPIENYSYPVSYFDIVASLYTLPFLKKDDVFTAMQKIRKSLRPNGIFVGQFFGRHDDWNGQCATHNRKEIKDLLKDMRIIKLEEEENNRPTATGKMKHWHVFHIIAQKV